MKSKLLLSIAMKIRVLRISRGWSQETLAELADLHRNYIGHVERAEVNIGIKNLDKIAKALDCNLSELLSGILNEQEPSGRASFEQCWREIQHELELGEGDEFLVSKFEPSMDEVKSELDRRIARGNCAHYLKSPIGTKEKEDFETLLKEEIKAVISILSRQ